MSVNFSVGYMRGTLWGLGIGVVVTFVLAFVTINGLFLWASLVLELLMPPVWAMKNSLEKGGK